MTVFPEGPQLPDGGNLKKQDHRYHQPALLNKGPAGDGKNDGIDGVGWRGHRLVARHGHKALDIDFALDVGRQIGTKPKGVPAGHGGERTPKFARVIARKKH